MVYVSGERMKPRPLALLALCFLGLMNISATTTRSANELQDVRFAHPNDKDHPADFKPSFAEVAAWKNRAEFVRRQALVAQGLWPLPPKTPLNPVIHGPIDRDTYTIEKVFFASMPGHYVSGNLYRPKGRSGKLPVVLAPYGHWPNGRFIWKNEADIDKEIKSGAEVDRDAARSPLQANCAMLARMGCIVFQYDMVGYCDSTELTHREGFTDAESILRLQSFMGLQTWNSVRSLDFVLSLPDVDPARVAVTGSSSGGTQTMALDAVDDRTTVAFPIVMVSMAMQGGCVCENAPLYRVDTNNVEIACLFAPKPEGMAAANDWTKDFMTRGLPEMKSIWRLFGAENQVEGQHFNFGHNHNLHSREAEYGFLNKHLKLGWPEPVKEEKFVPVPPTQLSVWDEAHPLPADAADAATLRHTMTRLADAQMDELSRSPAKLKPVIRAALKAMVVDQMPAATDVETSTPLDPASKEWSGFIGRRGAGERVPARAVFPGNWNGDVVIVADVTGCAALDSLNDITSRGVAILAIEPYMGGSFKPVPKIVTRNPQPTTTKPGTNPPYEGMTLCYQRSVIANRVHDLLTAAAVARSIAGTKHVSLVGAAEQGPAALLARAIAGDAVTSAAIDLNQFDFDQVHADTDPMLLPGGLKYGGIYAFVPLCDGSGPTLLTNARQTGHFDLAQHTPGVRIEPAKHSIGQLLDWLANASR